MPIRDYLSYWTNYTFEKSLSYVIFDPAIQNNFSKTSFYKKRKDVLMNGDSSKKLTKIWEGNTKYLGLRMSDIFFKSIEMLPQFCPIWYLLTSTEIFVKQNNSIELISEKLGRVYRSFPSFLRDVDYKERLEIIIEKFQPNLKINLSQNPDLDAKEHADCILTCTKKENTRSFYIWLYLVWKGDWSLINLINRLEQERGVIPNGTHLLVPLNIEENHNFEEIHKWWLYSDTYIKKNLDYCVKSFLKNEFPKMTRLQLITMNKRELKNKLKTFTKFYKP